MSRCDSCQHYYVNAVGSARCGAAIQFNDFSCFEGLPANVHPLDCRVYSIKDLDALRSAVRERVLYGSTYYSPDEIRHPRHDQRTPAFSVIVEDQIRTAMRAGITGQDIREADKYDYDNKATQ